MSDAEKHSETESGVAEDVTEEHAKKKPRGRGLGRFLLLLVLIGGGVAAWYYQSMWLPQAKTWVAELELWPTEEEPDLMAAPAVDRSYLGKSSSTETFVLKAMPDPEPALQVSEEKKPEGQKPEENIVEEQVTEQQEVASQQVTSDEKLAEPVAAEASEQASSLADIMKQAAAPADVADAPDESSATASAVTDEAAGETVVAKVSSEAETGAAKPGMEKEVVAPASKKEKTVTAQAPAKPEMNAMHKSDAMAKPEDSVTNSRAAIVDIQQARQAYWSRNLELAEASYKQLLEVDDSNVDTWGELGNVYYMQAKWAEAAEAYAETAIRLIKKGDVQRAMYMRHIVQRLDPKQAARVDEELQRIQAPAKG